MSELTISRRLADQARRAAFLASLTDAELERVCAYLHGDILSPLPFPAPKFSMRDHVAGESLLDRLVSL